MIRSLALIIPMKPLEGLMQKRAMLYLWLTCCGKHRQMFLRRVNKEACLPGQPKKKKDLAKILWRKAGIR